MCNEISLNVYETIRETMLYMPTEDELKKELERERRMLEDDEELHEV